MKKFLAVILIVFVVLVAFFGYKYYKSKNLWTLLVCESLMPNSNECYDISYEIPGFRSDKECLLTGTEKFFKEGFECGKGCNKEGELNVCSVVCNKSDCN